MNLESIFEMSPTATPLGEIAVRLTLAALAGMVLGIDRELRNRPAGLRTHMLVALAAAVFTVITFELYAEAQKLDVRGAVAADPIRVIEAVTAGVAFLAAGTIIRSGGSVQGITTGASVWLSGAAGTACGGGYYSIALLTLILAVPILYLLGRLQWRLKDEDGG